MTYIFTIYMVDFMVFHEKKLFFFFFTFWNVLGLFLLGFTSHSVIIILDSKRLWSIREMSILNIYS